MTFTKWFDTFLEEKNLAPQSWEIQHAGVTHFIDSTVIIEAIQNAPAHEQAAIKNMIIRIDFVNGDVNDYFKHLAKGLIANQAVPS
jgi:hypothetical protein